MQDQAAKRDEIIALLERALLLAEESGEAVCAFLIERALDEIRAADIRATAKRHP